MTPCTRHCCPVSSRCDQSTDCQHSCHSHRHSDGDRRRPKPRHAPEFRGALPRLCPGQQLVLDLTGITFCDSSGISVLIAATRR
ncbi:STAS domain-containing protein [Streptomyces sp. NPDC055962]|uniref:STAS domain-containing protein n=1 Tax=Streptomyces sp. NPDC055962 TaxID=3345667 RepID=UPI0035D89349